MKPDLYPTAILLEYAVEEIVPLEGTVGDFWCAILFADPREEPEWGVICRNLGWVYSTTNSRFARHGLNSPFEYLTAVRLVYTAHLFGNKDDRVAVVAARMGFAGPQSLGRHLRATTGQTAAEYRDAECYATARDKLLAMVREDAYRWATFSPTPPRVEVAA